MAKTKRRPGHKLEALFAALLLFSFFRPWLYSMGVPVAAYQIRERLAGPHRLISTFTTNSRISQDYDFAIYLYAIPLCAVTLLLLLFIRRYQGWMGCLAGTIAIAAYFFIRSEAASLPFHRLAGGPYLALVSGIGLVLLPSYRLALGK